MTPDRDSVLRVYKSKAQAKKSYDRMSRLYDFIAGVFEQRYKDIALKCLNIARDEVILEIGFGTGQCLKQIVEAVGEGGKVYGVDISSGMLSASKRRLEMAGLWSRVELNCQDALILPYADSQFDAVFMSFVLELFDSPEIPEMLAEIARVLKPNGRIGVISISKGNGASWLLRTYEWLHLMLPQIFDCRPIYVANSIHDAGFEIQCKEHINIMGLPGEIVIGKRSAFTG